MSGRPLSEAQIRSLLTEAAQAGDFAQVVLCERAMGTRVDPRDYEGGGHNDREMQEIRAAAKTSVAAARRACANAINDARGKRTKTPARQLNREISQALTQHATRGRVAAHVTRERRVSAADLRAITSLAQQDVSGEVDDSYARTGDAKDTIRRWYASASSAGDHDLIDLVNRIGVPAAAQAYVRARRAGSWAHASILQSPAHPYVVSPRLTHARVIHQEPTGRPVFAAHERDHHITTTGRRALERGQFALPPGPEEKRRGIKGRLPIDDIKRARSALARASMMHHRGDITAGQLAQVKTAVRRAWPSINVT